MINSLFILLISSGEVCDSSRFKLFRFQQTDCFYGLKQYMRVMHTGLIRVCL